jgi:hypothetical protein
MRKHQPQIWQRIGAHTVREEPPDVFFVGPEGDVSGPEMTLIIEALERFAAGRERVFYVTDVTRLGTLSPEARKVAARSPSRVRLASVVVYGANFHQRVMTTLLIKSAALFRRSEEVTPAVFLDTEARAQAWIDERRREAAVREVG